MALLILLTAHLIYAVKKGFDPFLLFSGACLLFFYPILAFDDIFFLSGQIHSVPVALGARVSLIAGMVFLLLSGWRFRNPILPSAPQTLISLVSTAGDPVRERVLSFLLVAGVGVPMLWIIHRYGFGLQGMDKVEMMSGLGYGYKLFSLMSALLTGYAFVMGRPRLIAAAAIAAGFDLLFGFRYGIALFLTTYVLLRPPVPGWRNAFWFLFGGVALAFIVLAKETVYFSLAAMDVLKGFLDTYGADGLSALSVVNAESASISAVFNETIRQDFSVSPIYLLDSFVSLFPFASAWDYEVTGFATYFKGVLFGPEGDSFASGMLSVGYAVGGYAGIAASFLALGMAARFHSLHRFSPNPLFRSCVAALTATLAVLFYRSDLVYIAGILRTLIVLALLLHLGTLVLSRKREPAVPARGRGPASPGAPAVG